MAPRASSSRARTPPRWRPFEPWRTRAHWENEYRAGAWDYLGGLDELSRYSVIAGYVRGLGGSPTILDLGCGEGLLIDHLPSLKHRYLGCDHALAAVKRARKRAGPKVSLIVADAMRLPFKPNVFDIVICNEILSYVPDLDRTVTGVLNLLSDGGHLIVSQFDDGTYAAATWRLLRARTRVVDMVSLTNAGSGSTWRVALLRPRRNRSGQRPPKR